jgi:hypothetical protein
MRLAIISIAWSWPITRWASSSGQLEHGVDLVARHAADRDAGPVTHHRGHGLVVDRRQDQRCLALQRGQPGLHVLQRGHRGGPFLVAERLGTGRRRGVGDLGFQLAARAFDGLVAVAQLGAQRQQFVDQLLLVVPARLQLGQALVSCDSCSVASASRSAVSMPMAFSRPMMPSSVFSASMRLRQSSTSAGVACRLTATRAQAVSIRLTDLSGSWRAGM